MIGILDPTDLFSSTISQVQGGCGIVVWAPPLSLSLSLGLVNWWFVS